jgi:hypothetical protein
MITSRSLKSRPYQKGATEMKKLFSATAALALLTLFICSAEAITVTLADVQNGLAVVEGNKATRDTDITWETLNVGKTTRGGSFSFSSVVPADCIGTLTIGGTTIDIALTSCTPGGGGGGSDAPAPVLKTGQTTCYNSAGAVINCPGTGQDGELQKGVARSYTDNGLTITDNATGLEWEKLCDGANCPVINDKDSSFTWDQAFQKIADLNTVPCFADRCDWRLPNINELQSLADYGRVNPAIDPVFNNGVDSFTQTRFYWSSTTYQGGPNLAWGVGFFDGFVVASGKDGFTFVRAVRGGS